MRALPTRILTAAAVLALSVAFAAVTEASEREATKPEVRYLWPDGAPGARGEAEADKPCLFVFLPPKEKATGAGVIVCPGGGYGGHAMDHEGVQVARFFNSIGAAAFVLRYRLKPYQHPIPLGDAQRALRSVRHDAEKYGLAPHRIGIMGFSAGGHLASTAGTHFDSGKADSADAIDRVGCRPDFLVLCYPVISFSEPFSHGGSRRNLLGDSPSPELVENLSNEKQVTKDTPPTFLFHTNEDRGVPAENSVAFFLALRKAGVPAELHVYQKGPHGVGLMPGDPVLSSWSKRLADWLTTNGFLSDAPRAAVKGKVSIDGKPLSYGTIAFVPQGEGNGRPTAVARVRRGGYDLSTEDGPVVGNCRVVITRMSDGVISITPTVPGAESFGRGLVVDVEGAGNTFDFDLSK